MIRISHLDESFNSIDDFLHAMVQFSPEMDTILPYLEDLVTGEFPDIDLAKLQLRFEYWPVNEDGFCTNEYKLDYNSTYFCSVYPEYFI